MVFKASGKPSNPNTLGLLGYLIVANKQIHNYQLEALEEYLTSIETNIIETCLKDILDGSDHSISFAASLSAYETETPEVKKEIYYMLLVLALVDDSIDEHEDGVIRAVFDQSALTDEQNDAIKELAASDASDIRKIRNTLFIRKKPEKQPKLHWIQKIFRWFIALLKRLMGKEDISRPDPEEIEYKTAIEQCAVVASEDFSSLSPIYKHIVDACTGIINEIKAYKMSLSPETGYSADVAEVITTFAEILNKDVLGQCQQAQISLDQKRRTVSDFTISLLGRTKAGKSTLHAILTNEGREKIGEGCQRTTRYNRVYQWNLLRLIDTPGIGSAEAAGRTDDEIAQSVLGESDILCVVVVDDSILRDVLEFIERIAALNKPIIILLNHKENIRPEVKYHRFLNNPREWIETEGEANLDGHISRILKYAQDHGFASLIKVYPVFLLPALMSSEEKYAEDSNLLWESSNVEAFIEQLKDWITVYGKIKRSQTILDEAVQVLGRSIHSIEEAKALLIEQKEKLIRQKKRTLSSLQDKELDALCNKAVERLNCEIEEVLSSDTAIYFFKSISESYSPKKHLFETRKAKVCRAQFDSIKGVIEIATGKTVAIATKDGKNSVGFLIKATEASGSQLHSVVYRIGKLFGYKFKPWQAANIAKNIGNIAKILGPVMSVIGLLIDVKDTVDENQHAQSIQKARLECRQEFIDVASDLEAQYSAELSRFFTVYDDITKQLQTSRDNVQNLIKADHEMTRKLLDVRNELVAIQTSIF